MGFTDARAPGGLKRIDLAPLGNVGITRADLRKLDNKRKRTVGVVQTQDETTFNVDLSDDTLGALFVSLAQLLGFGAAGGYLRSSGAAWVRVQGVDWGDLTSIPATFAPSAHTHPPADLTGFGAAGGYLRSDGASWVRVSGVAWGDLTSVPATFTPSAHTHAWADITSGVPATFPPSAHTHPASEVTTGTFGAGAFAFPGALSIAGITTLTSASSSRINFTTTSPSQNFRLTSDGLKIMLEDATGAVTIWQYAIVGSLFDVRRGMNVLGALTVQGSGGLTVSGAAGLIVSAGPGYVSGLMGIGVVSSAYQLDILTAGNNGIRIFNGTNYLYVGTTAGIATFGTLSLHDFQIVRDGAQKMLFGATSVTVIGNLLFTHATYDIGASGATSPRDIYLTRTLTVGGNMSTVGNWQLTGTSASPGQAGINYDADNGLSIRGKVGTAYDLALLRASDGVAIINVPTGTRDVRMAGDLNLWNSGSINATGIVKIGVTTNSSGDFLYVGANISTGPLVDVAGSVPIWHCRRANGTQAARSNVTAEDIVILFRGSAWSGSTGYWSGGEIACVVDGGVTDNQRPPSRWSIFANVSNAGAYECMRIDGQTTLGSNGDCAISVARKAAGAVALTRVQWKAYSTLAAADKVMIFSS